MTFSAVSTTQGGTTGSPSVTTHTVGDFVLIVVLQLTNNTVFPTALSSSNATWTALSPQELGVTDTWGGRAFIGSVTGVSTATVTITWSGTTPGSVRWASQEFSSTVGTSSVTLDAAAKSDSTSTNTWPSLTPTHGSGELYFGFVVDATGAVAGSTSGYVYDINADGLSDGSAYNVSCPNAATAPVWGDSTMTFGVVVLVYENTGGPTGPTGPAYVAFMSSS